MTKAVAAMLVYLTREVKMIAPECSSNKHKNKVTKELHIAR